MKTSTALQAKRVADEQLRKGDKVVMSRWAVRMGLDGPRKHRVGVVTSTPRGLNGTYIYVERACDFQPGGQMWFRKFWRKA